jgi:RNA polymerase sigma factor (sigma-70 family)
MTTASRVRLRLVGDERLVASVRRGDSAAFEAMYDRHSAELLSFCVYMLGSRQDAEDALQATFASAYRALRSDRRTVALRPWLFTIARNHCLSILRRRRPWVELNGEQALNGDPSRELELREEVRLMIEGLRALPESQRASLVLAELHGFSQSEIGTVLGVQAEQVKAFICQARSNLISERTAREADCREIREELATARGAALLRSRLRRHLRACDDCRVYANGVASQRRHLGVLLPLAPSLILKYRALEDALGVGVADPSGYAGGAAVGGTVAAGAVEVAGGGFKALALKIAAGVACLGAGAGAGASVLISPATPAGASRASAAATAARRGSSPESVGTEAALAEGRWGTTSGGRIRLAGAHGEVGRSTFSSLEAAPSAGVQPAAGSGRSEAERRQRSEERERRGDEQQRRAEEEHRRELEERAPGVTAQTQAARQRAQAERRANNRPRVAKTEAEHQQTHEERAAGRASRPPRTQEERQQVRREKKPERASRPPKSEAERQRLHEERLLRREEKKAETPGS